MGWIGVDLDRTLAYCEHFTGATLIGPPIPGMVSRVRSWLAHGKDVRIFTARISHPRAIAEHDAQAVVTAIQDWCVRHIGQALPVTNVKDWDCDEIWDDIAREVLPNSGVPRTSLL